MGYHSDNGTYVKTAPKDRKNRKKEPNRPTLYKRLASGRRSSAEFASRNKPWLRRCSSELRTGRDDAPGVLHHCGDGRESKEANFMKNKSPATKIGASVLITVGVIFLSSLLLPKTASIGAAPRPTHMTARQTAAAQAKAAEKQARLALGGL